ncbi:MAG: LPS export ABC transporter periplasmic protein LptC [Bacteroidetes bacterium]|nr:LPS export ABC transporter periplasmic protein LptC [Bacteroidota bacterium]
MHRKRHIGWILALLLLCTAGCERRAEAPTMDDVRAEDAPDQESWGVHFVVTVVPIESEESRVRMAMIADYMAQYEREDSTYRLLRGHPDSLNRRVVAYIFDAQGDSAATLTADRVFYYERDKRIEAWGRVVVVTREDKRLESEHLIWLEEKREVRTPGFVSIVTPTEQLQGYGLVADEDLRTFQIGRFAYQMTLDEEEEQ